MFNKILFFLLFPIYGYGQNTIGLPEITNYTNSTYSAGLQNWDIAQDQNGILYVANNEGMLTFDGKYWKLYPLPNKTIVRSVKIGYDNRIYVGSQDEMGYFSPSKNGVLQYHSINTIIPVADRSFGDVWNIASFNNAIFFRTPSKIFKVLTKGLRYTEDFPSGGTWAFAMVAYLPMTIKMGY